MKTTAAKLVLKVNRNGVTATAMTMRPTWIGITHVDESSTYRGIAEANGVNYKEIND